MKSWFTGKRASRGVNTGTDWQQRGNYGPTIISHFSNKYIFFLKSTQVLATILCFSFCCCVFWGGFWSWKLLCCHSQIIRWTGIDSIKSAPKETPTAQTRPTGPVQGRQFGEVTPRRHHGRLCFSPKANLWGWKMTPSWKQWKMLLWCFKMGEKLNAEIKTVSCSRL